MTSLPERAPAGKKCARARWLTQQLEQGHQVLRHPRATNQQRCAARRRINRAVILIRARLARQPLYMVKRIASLRQS